MGLRIVSETGDRYDDRLAALPDSDWASATNAMVTWWTAPGPGRAVRADGDLPGPLAWLAEAGALAWGPTIVAGEGLGWPTAPLVDGALADLGEGASRRFALQAAAVSGDQRLVALVLRRQAPRTVPPRTPATEGPATRVAIVEAPGGRLRQLIADGGPLPASLSWGDGALILGLPGKLVISTSDDTSPFELPLPGIETARALATRAGGGLGAGTAAGIISTWDASWASIGWWQAHEGVVTAVSWSPDGRQLASGGADGALRLWSPDGQATAELQLGGAVDAAIWLDNGNLVVKAGGQAGRILVLAQHDGD